MTQVFGQTSGVLFVDEACCVSFAVVKRVVHSLVWRNMLGATLLFCEVCGAQYVVTKGRGLLVFGEIGGVPLLLGETRGVLAADDEICAVLCL